MCPTFGTSRAADALAGAVREDVDVKVFQDMPAAIINLPRRKDRKRNAVVKFQVAGKGIRDARGRARASRITSLLE